MRSHRQDTPISHFPTALAGARPPFTVGLVTRAWLLANAAVSLHLEATMTREHELYADTAQAREVDRQMALFGDMHWADHLTSKQTRANNEAWNTMIRERDERQRATSRRVIASALDKMEAMCGTGAARRTA
jgi:hypothetical protein